MADTDARLYLDPHQSRTHEPTPYELELAGAIEEVFGRGTHDMAGLLEGLRATGLRGPAGLPWTEESFVAELRRLGA